MAKNRATLSHEVTKRKAEKLSVNGFFFVVFVRLD